MDRQPCIFVVDDEPDNFDVIETLLYQEGYQFHYAQSGQRALDRLDNVQPDVILLDVMMPQMNGIEVCRQIKADPKWHAVPIVMVTALTSKADLARCLAAGADDFVSKPVNSLELAARVKSMLRIKQQYDRLHHISQLREDMTYTIVHDLRNPLAIIMFAGDVLASAGLPEFLQRNVVRLNDATDRLANLIDDMLLLGKCEADKLVLTRTKVDLVKMTQDALKDFAPTLEAKQITLHQDLPDTSIELSLDASLMRRVLDNLLSNALKFSYKQGRISAKVELQADEGVLIHIADTGSGVSPEKRQAIFEKYEIGELVIGTRQLGLGLAFCKTIVEAHGGNISVDDNIPNGAIFSVYLPYRSNESNNA
ncbi:response regulator [Alkalinema pantanalense CENA528]|uniref:hybrid sensor histidine kinase/response regulator n=1 Tax=Alkalinema pantanalense TaxID=1620705 RepID=UPI003D6EBB6C